MSTSATITFQIKVDREITPEIMQALDNLTFAMQVQAEDGIALQDEEGESLEPIAFIEFTDLSIKHNA